MEWLLLEQTEAFENLSSDALELKAFIENRPWLDAGVSHPQRLVVDIKPSNFLPADDFSLLHIQTDNSHYAFYMAEMFYGG